MLEQFKNMAMLLVAIGMLTAYDRSFAGGEKPVNSFFALDNGVGRGLWKPAQQAQTLKELDYEGIGYNYTSPGDVDVWLQELQSRELKLFSLYMHAFPEKKDPYMPGMKEAIRKLKGTETVIWLTLRETRVKGDYDAQCVQIVSEVADMAKDAGLSVVLYGHKGFYVATVEDCLRIAGKVNRPNVGVTFNLCHELMAGNGDRMEEIVRKAAPRLMLVTINGADKDGKPDGYIQTLGKGTFDVAGFLRILHAVGYRGPIGLQSYNLKGDIRANLSRSMAAWKRMTATTENKEKL